MIRRVENRCPIAGVLSVHVFSLPCATYPWTEGTGDTRALSPLDRVADHSALVIAS